MICPQGHRILYTRLPYKLSVVGENIRDGVSEYSERRPIVIQGMASGFGC